jgi:hypothetical protein
MLIKIDSRFFPLGFQSSFPVIFPFDAIIITYAVEKASVIKRRDKQYNGVARVVVEEPQMYCFRGWHEIRVRSFRQEREGLLQASELCIIT